MHFLWPSVAIIFQRCKGKSQLSNDLGIRHGLSKIFLSLRVKEYLAESAPQLPTVYRHRQPYEGIVKSKVPNGKEQKAPSQEAFSCRHLASSTNVERSPDWFASKNCTAFDFIYYPPLSLKWNCLNWIRHCWQDTVGTDWACQVPLGYGYDPASFLWAWWLHLLWRTHSSA